MGASEAETQKAGGCPVVGHGGAALADATLTDPKILARPNAFYSAMRTEDPVHYDAKLGMYLVSRYDDLQKVLRDPITFSVERGYKEQYAKGFFEEFKEILERD